MTRLTILALAAVLATSAAQAATLDFGTGGPIITHPADQAITVSDGAFSASVSSGVRVNDAAAPLGFRVQPQGSVYQNALGLGVFNGNFGDALEIDGTGARDLVFFDFGREVEITSLTFTGWDLGDDYSIFAVDAQGGLSVFADKVALSAPAFGSLFSVETFAMPLRGTGFYLNAPGFADEYQLRSLTGEVVAAPVPLPAAALLLLGGLGALGVAARRKG